MVAERFTNKKAIFEIVNNTSIYKIVSINYSDEPIKKRVIERPTFPTPPHKEYSPLPIEPIYRGGYRYKKDSTESNKSGKDRETYF